MCDWVLNTPLSCLMKLKQNNNFLQLKAWSESLTTHFYGTPLTWDKVHLASSGFSSKIDFTHNPSNCWKLNDPI